MMANNRHGLGGVLLAAVVLTLFASTAGAVRKNDVLNSLHNLSATATYQPYAPARTVTATSETQICVFCHTPHGASTRDVGGNAIAAQLWNRRVPLSTGYTGYSSSSLDAATIQAGFSGQPGGSSKLCLSCHDGTLAVNTVNVINGTASYAPGVNIPMTGGVTTLPPGTYTATSGFTPVTGTNLTNDHPISVDFTSTLAARDGELRPVANTALQNWNAGSGTDIIGKRGSGYKPLLPLEPSGSGGTGQVQCAACHDPHIVETDTTQGDQMFLRTNRFQQAAATGTYTQANDIICLGCHEKNNGAVGAWAYSSHGNSLVATQTYTAGAVTPREFPANQPVWKASCLNCHQGHTLQGAKYLLSEGTTAGLVGGVPGAGGTRQGAGNPAQENTCYQCHTAAANSIITSTAPLIDIQTQMGSASRHPTAAATEVHDIGGNFNDTGFVDCSTTTNKCGADGIERRALLGTTLTNRHAECTDCHNPHRIVKEQKISDPINDAGYVAGGVHRHENAAGYVHDNIASGVLRGTWGVEPIYGSVSFEARPTGYTVKRGDPGATPSTLVTATYVTREYQVCLKCHSDYGYTDDNVYPSGTSRPALGGTGLTAINTNGRLNFTRYTNQAKEFQAPTTHRGDNAVPGNRGTEGGACAAGDSGKTAAQALAMCNQNNHRSWHPVFGPTGRSGFGTYKAPWNNAGARGVQTMYCSDCHGVLDTNTTSYSVIPPNRSPTAAHVAGSQSWGPHGGTTTTGTSVFMLKGVWSQTTTNNTANHLCFKCHCASTYGGPVQTPACPTGAGATGYSNGTTNHHTRGDHNASSARECQNCHVAIVHGWKNKSFLVNTNDIGPEAGTARGFTPGATYTNGPYYAGAELRIVSWAASGAWNQGNCSLAAGGH